MMVQLEKSTASVIGTKKKCLEIATCGMNPLGISSFIIWRVDKDILQGRIALESVTFNRRTRFHSAIDQFRKKGSWDVRDNLEMKKSWRDRSLFSRPQQPSSYAQCRVRASSHAWGHPDRALSISMMPSSVKFWSRSFIALLSGF